MESELNQESDYLADRVHDEKPVWVIGHKNPDTDAICSAMAYANLLSRTRIPSAQAACCGPPNSRTEWVLQQAGVSPPPLMANVYPRAADFCKKSPAVASPSDTVFTVYRQMTHRKFRTLPVTHPDGTLAGMLSLIDLLKLFIPFDEGDDNGARKVPSTTRKICEILDAEAVYLTKNSEEETDFIMMVAGSSEPVMSSRISSFPAERLLIITGDRVGVQLRAVEAGVRCLVITSGFRPSEAIVAAARNAGTAILVTKKDTASTTQLVRGARSIHEAISQDYLSFSPDATLQKIKQAIAAAPNQNLFPVCDHVSRQLIGVFSRTDLVNPQRPRLVLVDHNEFSQAVAGADEAEIIEVMDHHRLSGNLITREPVQFINMPVGSTCTIVGRAFRDSKLKPSAPIATLICAGIISDTLNLTSPTATSEDSAILNWASKLAGIDVQKFTDEFFSVGSVLRSRDVEKAILADRKEFLEKGYRLSISQVEETGLNYFKEVRDALQEELKKVISGNGLDFACLLVTDITRNNSLLLVEGPKKIRDRISYPREDPHLYVLNGVVSRKKQLFPYISMILNDIAK